MIQNYYTYIVLHCLVFHNYFKLSFLISPLVTQLENFPQRIGLKPASNLFPEYLIQENATTFFSLLEEQIQPKWLIRQDFKRFFKQSLYLVFIIPFSFNTDHVITSILFTFLQCTPSHISQCMWDQFYMSINHTKSKYRFSEVIPQKLEDTLSKYF